MWTLTISVTPHHRCPDTLSSVHTARVRFPMNSLRMTLNNNNNLTCIALFITEMDLKAGSWNLKRDIVTQVYVILVYSYSKDRSRSNYLICAYYYLCLSSWKIELDHEIALLRVYEGDCEKHWSSKYCFESHPLQPVSLCVVEVFNCGGYSVACALYILSLGPIHLAVL